jgi:hypothetical protein
MTRARLPSLKKTRHRPRLVPQAPVLPVKPIASIEQQRAAAAARLRESKLLATDREAPLSSKPVLQQILDRLARIELVLGKNHKILSTLLGADDAEVQQQIDDGIMQVEGDAEAVIDEEAEAAAIDPDVQSNDADDDKVPHGAA